jgi:hypothetical protein
MFKKKKKLEGTQEGERCAAFLRRRNITAL